MVPKSLDSEDYVEIFSFKNFTKMMIDIERLKVELSKIKAESFLPPSNDISAVRALQATVEESQR